MSRTLIASDIQFLDPLNCGSTIGWHVDTRKSYSENNTIVAEGIIILSDCSRKIEWLFDKEDVNESLAKIDKAIDILMDFRRELYKGSKEAAKASKLLVKTNEKK